MLFSFRFISSMSIDFSNNSFSHCSSAITFSSIYTAVLRCNKASRIPSAERSRTNTKVIVRCWPRAKSISVWMGWWISDVPIMVSFFSIHQRCASGEYFFPLATSIPCIYPSSYRRVCSFHQRVVSGCWRSQPGWFQKMNAFCRRAALNESIYSFCSRASQSLRKMALKCPGAIGRVISLPLIKITWLFRAVFSAIS